MKIRKIVCASLALMPLLLASCSSSKNVAADEALSLKIQEFKRDDYVLLDEPVTGVSKSFRLWILFIPFGGKSDQVMYKQAYDNALTASADKKADGLLKPKYTYTKRTVPLLLFGWTTKRVTADAKAFRLKTEAEYQATREPRKTE